MCAPVGGGALLGVWFRWYSLRSNHRLPSGAASRPVEIGDWHQMWVIGDRNVSDWGQALDDRGAGHLRTGKRLPFGDRHQMIEAMHAGTCLSPFGFTPELACPLLVAFGFSCRWVGGSRQII